MKHLLGISLGSYHCQCYKSDEKGDSTELTNQHKDPSFLLFLYFQLSDIIEM